MIFKSLPSIIIYIFFNQVVLEVRYIMWNILQMCGQQSNTNHLFSRCTCTAMFGHTYTRTSTSVPAGQALLVSESFPYAQGHKHIYTHIKEAME